MNPQRRQRKKKAKKIPDRPKCPGCPVKYCYIEEELDREACKRLGNGLGKGPQSR